MNFATARLRCRLKMRHAAQQSTVAEDYAVKNRSAILTCLQRTRAGAILTVLGPGNPGRCAAAGMNAEEERELRAELERLKQEHRDLDAAIDALLGAPGYDRLQVQRLKKRKLQLRDQVSEIEDRLFPDIIA